MSRLGPELVARARDLIALYPQPRSALVPICYLAQAQDGWVTPEAMEHVAELLDLTPAEVLGTVSFYDMLHTEPVGRHLIGVCTNIACLLNGAYELMAHAEEHLGARVGTTTSDGEFTLEEVECIAFCDQAPCLQVNYRFFPKVTNERFDALVDDLRSGRLAEVVPVHGLLSRVVREGGLAVPHDVVVAERGVADAAIAERKVVREAAAKAAEEAAKAADQAAGGGADDGPGHRP